MRKKKKNRDEDFDYSVADQNLGWSLPEVDGDDTENAHDNYDTDNANGEEFVYEGTDENGEEEYDVPNDAERDISDTVDEEDSMANFDDYYASDEENGEPEYEKPKKKRRGLFGLFGRKKQAEDDFDESENTYYGVQVKPIDELKMDFDPSSHNPMEDTYTKLFDTSVTALDDEIEENFNQIQRERRRRVAEAVENAGVDMNEVADEFGVIAPPPVTSYTGEIDLGSNDEDDEFAKAIRDSAKSRTMEIKLNVLNDTVELQKVVNVPKVDSDSIDEIEQQAKIYNTAEIDIPETLPDNGEQSDDADGAEDGYEYDENGEIVEPIEADEDTPNYYREFPVLEDVTRYRDLSLPVHNIDLDVIQSAVLSEADDYDEQTGEYRGRKVNPKKSRFKLFEGKDEPQDETNESIDDYTSPEDAPSVLSDLKGTISKLGMRTAATGFATIVLFFLGLILEGRGSTVASGSYVIISLILTGVAIALCPKNILDGLKGLIRFEPTSDSALAVAVVAVAVQHIGALFSLDGVSNGNIHLYGALAVGAIFLNSVGKLSMVRRIYSNFRFVTAREDKYAVRIYDDYNNSLKLAGNSVSGTPKIVHQKKVGFLKRFLELSYEPDPCEEAGRAIAPYGLILSLIITFIAILLNTSISSGISTFAASTLAFCVMTNMMGLNIPMSKFSKKVKRAGAMVSGYRAVESVSDATSVMLSDTDLFPKGTVTIGGIKAFESDGLEEAVTAATAMINEVGGTLADVFEQVITESGVSLPKVEELSLEGDNGVSAKVNGKQILLGNRDILISHNITPPEREDIMKYLDGGKRPLFIAVDDKLKAMIVVGYKADRRRKVELGKLKNNEIGLIVYSTDPNITVGFVSKLFDIGESRLNIVHGELASSCINDEKKEIARADATIATKGRPESLLSVVNACVKQKKVTKAIITAQLIGAVLGFIIVAFVSLGSAGAGISAVSLFLYEVLWTVIVMIIPKVMEK